MNWSYLGGVVFGAVFVAWASSGGDNAWLAAIGGIVGAFIVEVFIAWWRS